MINFNQYRQEIERNCNVFYDYILTLTRCKCCTRLNTQENRCAQWLFFGSVIQRNAQDHESDDPLSDRWDHDLVNPCPEWIPWITDLEINGFAWKECDRSVRNVPLACTQTFYVSFRSFQKHQGARKKNKNICRHLWEKRGLLSPSPMSTPYYHPYVTNLIEPMELLV